MMLEDLEEPILVGAKVGYIAGGDPQKVIQKLKEESVKYYRAYLIKQEKYNKPIEKTEEDFNLLKREIREVWWSDVHKMKVILIEGEEQGKFWDMSEVEGKKNPLTINNQRGAEELIQAIAAQASKDLEEAEKYFYGKRIHEDLRGTKSIFNHRGGKFVDDYYTRLKKDAEMFFTKTFSLYSTMDGKSILKRLEKAIEESVPETERTWVYGKDNWKISQAYNGHVKVRKGDQVVWDGFMDKQTKEELREKMKEIKKWKKSHSNTIPL